MMAKMFKMIVSMVMALYIMSAPIQAKAAKSELEEWIADLETSEVDYGITFASILKEVCDEGYDDGLIIRAAKLHGGVYTSTDTCIMVDYETRKAVKVIFVYNDAKCSYIDDSDVIDMIIYRSDPVEIDVNINTVYWF